MGNINDTTPRLEHLGTKDEAGVQVYPQPKKESLWLPKIYAFSSKGDSSRPYEVTGSEFKVLFGAETIDPRSKYFNHQLFLANKVFKAGGSVVFQKLDVPADVPYGKPADALVSKASKSAGVTLYAMVAEADIPNIKRDASGKKIMPEELDGTIPGYSIAFVASDLKADAMTEAGGKLDDNDATLYPILSLESVSGNEVYNNYGLTIESLIGPDNDAVILEKLKALQVSMGIVSKETGTVKKFTNVLGLGSVDCTFKPFSVNPTTNEAISVEDKFPSSWENIIDTNLPMIPSPFKDVVIHDGLAELTNLLSAKEFEYIEAESLQAVSALGNTEWDADDRATSYNWLSLRDVENENLYYTATLAKAPLVDFVGSSVENITPKVVDISDKTPLYLRGGEDGTVSELEVYEEALLSSISEYADRDSKVQSIPLNPENIFIDTGFSLNTSLKLPVIQTHRADIELILSTYEFNREDRDGENVPRDITSSALLRNAISLTPESKEYNTPTSRGTIIQGCGKDRDRIYPYLLPNTIELGWQSALYMAGSSWNGRYKFGGQPGSLFSALTDIRPSDLPFSVKSKLHNTGTMYAEVEDRGNWFFPTYQGVYIDGTSPLASYHTNIALTYFVKLHHRMWRKYTGRKDLSQGELKDLIEADMRESLSLDKFNNEFKDLVPEVYFLEFDTQAGHIWRQRIYTYSDNERMLAISDNVIRRASDLLGGN